MSPSTITLCLWWSFLLLLWLLEGICKAFVELIGDGVIGGVYGGNRPEACLADVEAKT